MFISWMMAAFALAKLYASNSQYQVLCHKIQEGLEGYFSTSHLCLQNQKVK